jgi:MYXO-CTERM domain-containing protein
VVTYEPERGYQGTDEFEYTVQDGQGGEATATVTVDVGLDTDDDGLVDFREAELGTDPNDPDTDDDELLDGLEVDVAGTDPLDDDTDDDGLLDGTEDADHDGAVDETETSPLDPDTDDDGVQDGTESGLAEPEGDDTDEAVFVPDADPASRTDPLDDDTDDDGLMDGTEDADHDGAVDELETSASDWDTDGDGLSDGLELGLTEPEGDDTDMNVFVPDADPSTTTNPRLADTDRMGRPDGVEDANHNGRVDEGETDPNNGADDTEPLGDGCNCGVASARPSGTGALLLLALAALAALRRRHA